MYLNVKRIVDGKPDTRPSFHFEWQKRLQSMERKYRGAVCELLSHERKNLHFYPECARSQQDLTLSEVNKLTCMHH